jgi:hypothetical protein
MRTLIEKESGHPVGHKEQLALRLARKNPLLHASHALVRVAGRKPDARISSGGVLCAATR